jgi:peptidyl-prolyl cis-trans isomerase C
VNTSNSTRRSLLLLLAAAFLDLGCNNNSAQQAAPNAEDIIVRVGDAVLTLPQLDSEIPPTLRGHLSKEQLENYAADWLNAQLLYQEAKRQGLDKQPQLQWRLQQVECELLGDALVEKEISNRDWPVSDSEIQKFYTENSESFKRTEAEIQVWHLVVPRLQQADSLRRALTSSTAFSRVARERALAQGGPNRWEIYYPESEVPEAAKEILKLRPGAISAPIAFEGGYHLFYIVERFRPESLRPLNLVGDEIVAKLKAQKQEERYRGLLAELANNTKIEKNFQLLENIVVDSILTRSPAR